jgi:GxxExxY protein
LLPEHEAQLINYLRITRQPLGYLINFGKAGGLDFKRILLSEFLPR